MHLENITIMTVTYDLPSYPVLETGVFASTCNGATYTCHAQFICYIRQHVHIASSRVLLKLQYMFSCYRFTVYLYKRIPTTTDGTAIMMNIMTLALMTISRTETRRQHHDDDITD